jgi:hypothetical protein
LESPEINIKKEFEDTVNRKKKQWPKEKGPLHVSG